MTPAYIILGALVLVGTILYLTDKKPESAEKQDTDNQQPTTSCADDCCGINDVCPSDHSLAAACSDIVYYDDEELDQFKGRTADQYSADEMEQFRDVLYTLQHADLLGWRQSLKKRGIILPAPLHDEFLMLYNEPQPTPPSK